MENSRACNCTVTCLFYGSFIEVEQTTRIEGLEPETGFQVLRFAETTLLTLSSVSLLQRKASLPTTKSRPEPRPEPMHMCARMDAKTHTSKSWGDPALSAAV